MWQVDNRTPFAAGQSWVRDLDGAETWLVVVKASFDVLDDGSTRIAKLQPAPVRTPVYHGEPGQSSIVYENDFVLTKTTTDIVVNGSVYAPDGRPATSVDVGFRVGPVTKVLRALGDRSWNLSGAILSDPQPFTVMPLVYERAFGGVDPGSPTPQSDWYRPNPVGTGFLASDRAIADVRVANIEYPDDPIRSWKGRPRPAGFGVIGPHWEERALLTGTYDKEWEARRQPLLPSDFDLRFFQVVPADQQAPQFLNGGEPVSLMNLTPSGLLRFLLPAEEIVLETHFMDGERRAHPPVQLHTVILEPDASRVSLVWHSALECHSKVYKLDHTTILRRTATVDGEGDDEEIGSLLDL